MDFLYLAQDNETISKEKNWTGDFYSNEGACTGAFQYLATNIFLFEVFKLVNSKMINTDQ